MQRRLRRIIPLCVLLLALAACDGDDATSDDQATGDDETSTEAETNEEETPTDDGEDANDEEDGNDDGENGDEDGEADGDAGNGGSATVAWDGETYEYDGVACRDSSSIEKYQMRTMRDPDVDAPSIDIRFDVDDGGPDLTGGVSVELFFNHGATIGEGEGYQASVDASTIASDASGASGELHLDPDNHSMADELNPDGGTIEFELICP